MATEKFKAKDVTPTVLRLHPDIKEELMRLAVKNDRSLSKEISIRLKVSLAAHGPTLQGILAREAAGKSLPASYTAAHTPTVQPANDNGPASALTDIDRAMLTVFRAMPPEKQLALLSLFR